MKKFTLSLALACALGVTAAEPGVTVVMHDGTVTSVPRSGIARINLAGTDVVVEQKDAGELSFPKADVARIVLSDESGIAATQTEAVAVYPLATPDVLTVAGLATPRRADIFSRSGATVFSDTLQPGTTTLSLSSLPADVYLLRLGDKTYKIVKL